MKLFLLLHFIMWACWTGYVVLMCSVWSGFTHNYIEMVIPFVLLYSQWQVLPYSVFAFLVIFFLKSTFTVSFKKK